MMRCLLIFLLTSTIHTVIQGKQCGRVQVENGLSNRVLGGHVAQKRNWPWLVQISAYKSSTEGAQCSGTLVSDRHVLTAAHCFQPQTIRVAVSSRIGNTTGFTDMQARAVVHHKYDFNNLFPAYDVAIVKLSRPIAFSESNQPICIADSFRENIGETGYVVGYGYNSVNQTVRWNRTVVDEGGKRNVSTWNITYNDADGWLHENLIEFRTIDRCESLKTPVGTYLRHIERSFCAVGNKRVTAKGDSGGPLMVNRKGVWYQVGTTSIGAFFDDDDGQAKWFSMYTRLSRACDWIEKVTGKYVKCAPMNG